MSRERSMNILNAEPGKIKWSMRAFIDYYEPEKAIVVAYNGKKGEMRIDGCTVFFILESCFRYKEKKMKGVHSPFIYISYFYFSISWHPLY
jgi:hypothetical protein